MFLIFDFGCPEAALAHTVGISRGAYQLAGNEVTAELVFARPELIGALPSLDANNDGSLSQSEADLARVAIETTIVGGLEVISPSGRCAGNLEDALLTEQDGLSVHATYRCSYGPQSVRFNMKFLDALSYGHRHLATATTNDVTLHAVVYKGNSTFQLADSHNGEAENVIRAVIWPLFRLGIQHILTGYDHLVFLLGLILVSGRLRQLLVVISSFTIAHSITLGLAALGVWAPRPIFVEPAIALSIAYIGVENWFIKNADHRWLITFPFGLIHGFGFAGALQEIALPHGQIPLALGAFNVGVEAGQIAFLVVVLPVVLWLRQQPWFANRGVKGMSTGIALAGACWFIIRLHG